MCESSSLYLAALLRLARTDLLFAKTVSGQVRADAVRYKMMGRGCLLFSAVDLL